MPSRFEPCGLNQMYSLRYGTVPIVRAVGGLEDTVDDFDLIQGTGNGFKISRVSGRQISRKRYMRPNLPTPTASLATAPMERHDGRQLVAERRAELCPVI